MNKLDIKKKLLMALTIFSMFFGAGNLIFPPFLALESGGNFLSALIGFFITAIGFPVLGLLAVGHSSGLRGLGDKVHPVFGFIFSLVLYLSIGPLLAIPRTAGTSYEMVAVSFGVNNIFVRILYSVVFFVLSGIIALEPQKFTSRLGKILCPILLVMITILFLGSLTLPSDGTLTTSEKYVLFPFSTGMIDGYQTMDAIAAIVFGVIITINIKNLGISDQNTILKEERIAGLLSIIPFLVVYSFLAVAGRKAAYISPDATNGAQLLSVLSGTLFGKIGNVLISLIFIVACFNTSTSLLSSVSEFFASSFPKVKRSIWIMIFAFSAMVFSNFGLNMILKISVPILNLLYPVTISLIILEIIPYTRKRKIFFKTVAFFSLLSSLVETISPSTMGMITYKGSAGFLWVQPTLLSALVVLVITIIKEKRIGSK